MNYIKFDENHQKSHKFTEFTHFWDKNPNFKQKRSLLVRVRVRVKVLKKVDISESGKMIFNKNKKNKSKKRYF